jgi:replication initiation factor
MSSSFTLTIDWLAFTVPDSSPQETAHVLEADWNKGKAGFRGYPLSWIWTESQRGLGKLCTGAPRRPREVHIDLSAGIVSTWATEKARRVLHWVREKQGHVTRIDCALDDRACLVPLSTVRDAVRIGQCLTRAERMQVIESGLIHAQAKTGETLYFGSPKSQTLLRIYYKRLELQSKQREEWPDYGIRWELELKKERANLCAACLVMIEETDWREYIVGLLRAYEDFRDTTRDEEEDLRYRAPLLPWYAELTDGFRKGRLVVEKEEPSLPRVKQWIVESVAPMLAVICAVPHGQAWLEREIVAAMDRWKDRHRKLLKKPSATSRNLSAGGNASAPQSGDQGVS